MGSTPIGISGSRAAAILGMSPWSTPFKVWQDIMEARQPGFNAARGYDYEAFEGNASTRWGLAFEDAVIKLAEEKADFFIIDREEENSYFTDQYITCHIDGRYNRPEHFNHITLHEGKTTTAYGFGDKWGEPGTDRIPVEYQIQTQHQMLCTGADEVIVSVLVFPKRPDDWEALYEENKPGGWHADNCGLSGWKLTPYDGDQGNKIDPSEWARTLSQMGYFHQYIVKSDKDLHALMLDKYRVWWTKYVIGETPPDPANYADIRSMITAPVGTMIVDPDTARWFKEFKDIGGEIGASGNLAKRRDQLKTLILERARGLETALDDESVDKWVFRDDRGRKLGSYGKNAKGSMTFR